MKNLKISTLILGLLISFYACQKTKNFSPLDEIISKPLSVDYTNRLDKVFDSVCTVLKIKGAQASILVPNVGIWKKSYGFSHEATTINNEMALTIGSNTKTYISALILKLQEQNILSINDTIGKWIKNKPYTNGQVTIKQLLNHTSGFGDFTFNPAFIAALQSNLTRVWNPEEAYQYFEPPVFTPPGTNYSYSDQNYVLLGFIIKAITGKPVEAVLREKILAPLNLAKTFYYPFENTTLIIPHSWSDNFSATNSFEDLNARYGYTIKPFCSADNAAGGMIATAEENVIFWHRLVSGKIVNQLSLNLMKQFVENGNGQGYGLGLVQQRNAFNGRTILFHDGYVPGSVNTNAVDTKSNICFSILTNQDKINVLSPITAALHKVTLQYTK